MALDNVALIVAGMLVGASGSILTKQMADAMNRSIGNVFFGGFGGGGDAAAGGGALRGRAAAPRSRPAPPTWRSSSPTLRLVVVVRATAWRFAQAQRAVADLALELEKRGVEVLYANPSRRGPHAGPHARRPARRGRPCATTSSRRWTTSTASSRARTSRS
jgi:NAD(P) transhydrogenase subunit beta